MDILRLMPVRVRNSIPNPTHERIYRFIGKDMGRFLQATQSNTLLLLLGRKLKLPELMVLLQRQYASFLNRLHRAGERLNVSSENMWNNGRGRRGSRHLYSTI